MKKNRFSLQSILIATALGSVVSYVPVSLGEAKCASSLVSPTLEACCWCEDDSGVGFICQMSGVAVQPQYSSAYTDCSDFKDRNQCLGLDYVDDPPPWTGWVADGNASKKKLHGCVWSDGVTGGDDKCHALGEVEGSDALYISSDPNTSPIQTSGCPSLW